MEAVVAAFGVFVDTLRGEDDVKRQIFDVFCSNDGVYFKLNTCCVLIALCRET